MTESSPGRLSTPRLPARSAEQRAQVSEATRKRVEAELKKNPAKLAQIKAIAERTKGTAAEAQQLIEDPPAIGRIVEREATLATKDPTKSQ
jgi:ElaB/YqjD/DUF883 family membrane-anchored ribosome-binding protein